MLTEPELFTDEPGPRLTSLVHQRAKRGRTAGLLAVIAAAVAAGVLVGGNLGALTSSPAPAGTSSPSRAPSAEASTSPPASAGPAATPAASAPASAGAPSAAATAPASVPAVSNAPVQSQFTSGAAGVSFTLPPGWNAAEVPRVASIYPATTGVEVYDEAGQHVATFEHWFGGGLGGACGPGEYIGTELDSEPVGLGPGWGAEEGARFSYRIQDRSSVGEGFIFHLGLVGEASDQFLNTCHLYSMVAADDGSMLSFAKTPGVPVFQDLQEAKAYMGTEEYRNLKDMILSLRLP
jgi:hypothetical protein